MPIDYTNKTMVPQVWTPEHQAAVESHRKYEEYLKQELEIRRKRKRKALGRTP